MPRTTDRPRKPAAIAFAVAIAAAAAAVLIGAAIGLALAETANIKNFENFDEFAPDLPSRILDINDEVITEFSAQEKRELVSVYELPRCVIDAVLAREDRAFYQHKGFKVSSIARAAWGVLTKQNLGGGSTITQQLAGLWYLDRSDISVTRKVRELWYALQLERRFTKNEILEHYLNKIYIGDGTYGVEAASKYYFKKSIREVDPAEAAMIVIQFSNPAAFNPFRHPNAARTRQKDTLDKMVALGSLTREEADSAFQKFWDDFDYTRVSTAAYLTREDKAPWFSEYVRRELVDNMLYGTLNLHTDGLTVRTTLDLKAQAAADKYMARGLEEANKEYRKTRNSRLTEAESTYVPIVDLLALAFDIEAMHATSSEQIQEKAASRYVKRLNPIVDAAALLFDLGDLKQVTNSSYAKLKIVADKNIVQGALVSIEQETGYIKALIGGSTYNTDNQTIRATQGRIQPGSSFKPLFYSAAIDSRKFTPATLIYDQPAIFYTEDGIPYIPLNHKGEWKGPVLLWYALAHSMNVPAVKVLDGIGFDAAIDRAAALLGETDPERIRKEFPRRYPLALGTISTNPLSMARAFAVFANQGREVTPIAIRQVEDRKGNVILEPEKDLRLQQKRKGSALQIVSPQNAYVMTTLLEETVRSGTLAYAAGWGSKFSFRDKDGKRFVMPAAGKTGTTQNWADAWTVGFTPYYTTAVWFGFDLPGNSLGVSQTGATIAGPAWADFMREVHDGLPPKTFVKPSTGIIELSVCSKSGDLPTPDCNEGTIKLTFLEGTQPTRYCELHSKTNDRAIQLLRQDTLGLDYGTPGSGLDLPELPALPALPDLGPLPAQQGTSEGSEPAVRSESFNPLLD